MAQSGWENRLQYELTALGVKGFVTQYRFAPPRRWTFDFAFPDQQIAVECEGGIWIKGRHSRGKGYEADCEKYNEACLRGWRVLRVTTGQIASGAAHQWIQRALGASARAETASDGKWPPALPQTFTTCK